ncbi:hypothetical protein GCM10007338_10210 [Corynebacterium pelargi]|nr:hypothetical protein GCM10007338_10210 [Corynebacterium pelargi]
MQVELLLAKQPLQANGRAIHHRSYKNLDSADKKIPKVVLNVYGFRVEAPVKMCGARHYAALML